MVILSELLLFLLLLIIPNVAANCRPNGPPGITDMCKNCTQLPEYLLDCEYFDGTLTNHSFKEEFGYGCTEIGGELHHRVQHTRVVCKPLELFTCFHDPKNGVPRDRDPVEVERDRLFLSEFEKPCILYKVGIIGVDRFCLGWTGIGVGKMLTLGGLGIWHGVMEANNTGSGGYALSLRVMRLAKPTIVPNWPLQVEEEDYCAEQLLAQRRKDIAATKGLHNFPFSDVLTVPQNFGSIYLGETFSSFINVQNESSQTVRDVVLKTDLQTSSQRVPLSNSNGQAMVSKLVPGENISEVIHHEIKELGSQLLVCSVSYINTSGEKQMFRKYFRFLVLKPLDVKTKFFTTEKEEIFLEAQITNTTPHSLHMQKVVLAPSPLYKVTDLNITSGDNTVFSESCDYMNPDDVWQYLYKLSPKSPITEKANSKGVSSVGKLDIMWLSNFGEKGRLQSSQLQRLIQPSKELIVTIHSMPHFISTNEQFLIVLRLRNTTEKKYNLHLTLRGIPKSGLVWIGNIKRLVGEVPPNSFVDVNLDVLPIKSGVWDVGEITIENLLNNKKFSYKTIGQILVGVPES